MVSHSEHLFYNNIQNELAAFFGNYATVIDYAVILQRLVFVNDTVINHHSCHKYPFAEGYCNRYATRFFQFWMDEKCKVVPPADPVVVFFRFHIEEFMSLNPASYAVAPTKLQVSIPPVDQENIPAVDKVSIPAVDQPQATPQA
ncbi:hypothetical protein T10_5988 [Trichinella papuae]|uniref:Uncharacterized protein n=1 Tax=Trichinella papuae TaxID=268474 RepID=A0A0V1M0S7_9BILA|nr:hypothetical protein T10_1859 [Trichinella papuae]KRZ65337.1 hypothetical protein T10_5988 [Trichinella papuae]